MCSFATRWEWRRGWASVAIVLAISALASFARIDDATAAEVTGKVLDRHDRPVPNATVRLERVPGEWDVVYAPDESDQQVTTRSRESGRYVLRTVMPGRYRLTCGGSSSREIYVGIGSLQKNCSR